MKARLQDKFVRVFIFPLLCGIFISITFTVIVLFIYASGLSTSTDLISIVQEADNNKTEPILLNAGNILFRKLQTPINALFALKEYYLFLINSGKLNFDDVPKMKKFINKYALGNKDLIDNYNATLINISANGNETYLDYSSWFVDETIQDVDSLSDIALKQLYINTNMNLMFKSHYQVNAGNAAKAWRLMYSAYSLTKLLTSYPITSCGPQDYSMYYNFTNPSWCRDKDNTVPTSYYFPCRPWYQEALQLYNNNGLEVIVTTPYISAISRVDVTVCIRFTDILVSSNSTDNFVMFCLDLDTADIFYVFDEYNNLLSGYFFIMRIKSEVPIYYPNIVNFGYQGNIVNFEYSSNIYYYINELNDYKNVLEDFVRNINSTEGLTYQDTGQFLKAGINNTYKLYPILYNLKDDPTKPQHLLTIVYITIPQSYMDTIYKFQKVLYPRLIFQIIIFIIMGSILILISRYLINSIAINIVKPIRMMKRMLEGMNNKKLSSLSVNNYEMIPKEEVLDSVDVEEEVQNIKEEENDEEEDEYIGTRSTDIENLFITLLDLKKVLVFTQDTSLAVNNDNILNFLFAKHKFNEVKNFKGKFLCDSNVGNLALKCKKYDKAIFHLVESIYDPQNNVGTLNKKSIKINSKATHSTKKTFKFSKKFESRIGNLAVNIDTRKIEMIKKKFLDSRYPKLLYSFKKYYKNLSKLIKQKSIFDSIASQDFFALSERHSLEQYEIILKDYYHLAESCHDKKKQAEALLELIEFYIVYKLKSPSKTTGNNMRNKFLDFYANAELKKSKEDVIVKINEGLKLFDSLIVNLMSNINMNEYLKKIIDMINVVKKDSMEIIETPIYVINQKANYIKGKFCYYCENFTQALKFFNESRKMNVISNAVIIRDSIKKLKKIFNIVLKKNEVNLEETIYLLENEKTPEITKKLNFQITEIKEAQIKIKEYREILNEEIVKYSTVSKDIAVLINFSTSVITDSKQIDQAISIAEHIFENLTTSNDRFTLFAYTAHSNPLINLCYKNISTIDYIRDQINRISEKNYYEEFADDSEPNLIKAAENVYDYLAKKEGSGNREKWIIVLTTEITKDDSDFIRENNIHEKIFDFDKNINLIIITGKNFGKKGLHLDLEEKLKFNKSGIIESDKLDTLKRKMKIMGSINDEILFLQEKYDNYNKN